MRLTRLVEYPHAIPCPGFALARTDQKIALMRTNGPYSVLDRLNEALMFWLLSLLLPPIPSHSACSLTPAATEYPRPRRLLAGVGLRQRCD